MSQLSDTSPEAEQVLRECYRKMPFARKWCQMGALYRTAKLLHAAGVRQRNPTATDGEIRRAWMTATLGEVLQREIKELPVEANDENLPVVREVIAVLSRLDIPYALGGSWASSLLGKMRFTHDADITVEPFPGKEAEFCAGFGHDYYVSLPAVQQAVRQRSSFNIIYTLSSFKVDVFVHKDRPFDQSVMRRRRPHSLADSPGHAIQFVSPEDIILLKLEWYRLGGESSEQQWRDVQGVLQIQAVKLDQAYLDHWAKELKIEDLLACARQESET